MYVFILPELVYAIIQGLKMFTPKSNSVTNYSVNCIATKKKKKKTTSTELANNKNTKPMTS